MGASDTYLERLPLLQVIDSVNLHPRHLQVLVILRSTVQQ